MELQWMTTQQAAKKWNVSLRYVQRLLATGRVLEVKKYGRAWMIPAGAKKPSSEKAAQEREKITEFHFSYLWDCFSPRQEMAEFLQTVTNKAVRTQCLAEIAYLQGDFKQARCMALEALDNKATRISAALFLLLVAISTNDFALYMQIEELLKRLRERSDAPQLCMQAQITLAAAAVCMFAPAMVPNWLKEGEISRLPKDTALFAMYLRVKYLQSIADYSKMLAVAQTMLSLCKGKGLAMDIYLLLMCAIAYTAEGSREKALEYLQEALSLAMPQGFLTPFVENIAPLNGLVEECVKKHYPFVYEALIAQWQATWKNWAIFHNRFAKDNVTLLLTLRESRIATLAANRICYAEIARQEGVSVGRLRNIIQEIYSKLFISNRKELAEMVLWKSKNT